MSERIFSIEDALIYLDKIKCAYAHNPEVYSRFLKVMKEFKLQIIKSDEVIRRVSTLFTGNEHLVYEFAHFLPCEIDLSHSAVNTVEPQEAPVKMQQAHAMQYVIKVRNRFIHHPMVYSHFLEVLNVYHSQQQSISDVLEQIAGLFADETDLLSEFAHFLPPSAQEQAKRRMYEAMRAFESRREQRVQQENAELQWKIQLVQQEEIERRTVTPPPITPENTIAHQSVMPPPGGFFSEVRAPPVQLPNIVEPAPSPSHGPAPTQADVSTASSSSSDSSTSSSDGSESSDGFEEIGAEEVHIKAQSAPQPPPTPQEAPRRAPMTRSVATCFKTASVDAAATTNKPRASRKRRIFHFSEPAPLTRSKATHNTTTSSNHHSDAPSTTPTAANASLPQKSTSLNVQCLWSRSVQMSGALADLDRRLGTVECMLDLQRQRIESQSNQILELKSLLNGKKKK